MHATCPVCSQPIDGELADLTAHVKRCGKTKKSSAALDLISASPEKAARPVELVLPMRFELTTAIPSQNTAHSQYWTTYHKMRAQWRTVVQYHMAPLHDACFMWSKWHFLRLVPARGKLYDAANLIGGAKPVVDALSHLKIIHDDAIQFFSATYDQQRIEDWVGKNTTTLLDVKTVITLLEAR